MKAIIKLNDFYSDMKKYVDYVKSGQELYISENNNLIFELKPLFQEPINQRPYGLCKGEIFISEDFDDNLPEDIIGEFEGR
jgi:hypothetical protein